jgi:hypothetical protein
MWAAMLNYSYGTDMEPIEPYIVALMLALNKLCRATENPKNLDSFVDAAVYEFLSWKDGQVKP